MRASGDVASERKVRVLVVEDEYFIADDIARSAGAHGCEVLGPLSELDAALRLVASGAGIDVAVLDIDLRGRQVFELADLLAASDVPFVFATGYGPNAIPQRFRSIPRWDKPFDHDQLVTTIAAMGADANGQPNAAHR